MKREEWNDAVRRVCRDRLSRVLRRNDARDTNGRKTGQVSAVGVLAAGPYPDYHLPYDGTSICLASDQDISVNRAASRDRSQI